MRLKMSKRLYDYLEIRDIKDMLNKTKELYGKRPSYKIRIAEGKYQILYFLLFQFIISVIMERQRSKRYEFNRKRI